MTEVAATVGDDVVLVDEVDAAEEALRATRLASSLPRPGTSEGRQLRRWLTQVLAVSRVLTAEARAHGVTTDDAPAETTLLPDVAARLQIGSVAAAALEQPIGRALFADVTADVAVSDREIADYHRRNPVRFSGRAMTTAGWVARGDAATLDEVRPAITAHLLAAAQRREFRRWLDARLAALVVLSPGYEHPGDPRQPDNTHRH